MTMHILVIRCWVNNYLVFNFFIFFKKYKPKGPFTNCGMLRGGLSDELRDLVKIGISRKPPRPPRPSTLDFNFFFFMSNYIRSMLANRLRRWPNFGWTPRACMGERHDTNIYISAPLSLNIVERFWRYRSHYIIIIIIICQPLMLTCLIRCIDCRPIRTTVLHYRGGSMLGQRRSES